MKNNFKNHRGFIMTAAALMLCVYLTTLSFSARAADEVKCHLTFELRSWSVFYKSGKGSGTVSCDNGQSAAVKIKAHGGGITFGKQKIVNGRGTFSKVDRIGDLYGTYAVSEAHAGASKSAGAGAMWKGDVSLVLSGDGSGWDIGFAFGSFKLSRK